MKRKILIVLICAAFLTVILFFVVPLIWKPFEACEGCKKVKSDLVSLISEIEAVGKHEFDFVEISSDLGIKNDPWGNEYVFFKLDNRSGFCFLVLSYGADGKFGGGDIYSMDRYELSCRENIQQKGIQRAATENKRTSSAPGQSR